jgi:hypothetical protein
LLLVLVVLIPHTLRQLRRPLFRILLGLLLPVLFLSLLLLCLLSTHTLDAGFGFEVDTLIAAYVCAVSLVLRAIEEVTVGCFRGFAAATFRFLRAVVGCRSSHCSDEMWCRDLNDPKLSGRSKELRSCS